MWETVSTRIVHAQGSTRVRVDTVRTPSGTGEYVTLDNPPVSLVVPIHEDGRIVLVKQFRYAWRRSSWECPAGHGEPGESEEATARRELEEETGIRAATLEKIGSLHASAKTSARFTLFRARGLVEGKAHPEPDEDVSAKAFSPAEVRELIAKGEIVHGPSIAALLLAL